jgi:hypothetical protein
MDEVRGPPRKLPRIFIEEEDGLKEFFLVVYQVLILHCFRLRTPPSLGKVGCQWTIPQLTKILISTSLDKNVITA